MLLGNHVNETDFHMQYITEYWLVVHCIRQEATGIINNSELMEQHI